LGVDHKSQVGREDVISITQPATAGLRGPGKQNPTTDLHWSHWSGNRVIWNHWLRGWTASEFFTADLRG